MERGIILMVNKKRIENNPVAKKSFLEQSSTPSDPDADLKVTGS